MRLLVPSFRAAASVRNQMQDPHSFSQTALKRRFLVFDLGVVQAVALLRAFLDYREPKHHRTLYVAAPTVLLPCYGMSGRVIPKVLLPGVRYTEPCECNRRSLLEHDGMGLGVRYAMSGPDRTGGGGTR